ncbi:MAG: NAD(P)/FAD-dependent oxidoreductase [Anaerolineales bacterium]
MLPEQTEVLIVGAGPAGLAAGVELRRLGVANVLIVEREEEPGGIPRLCHHTGFGLRDRRWVYSGPGYARRYVQTAERAGIELRTTTTITGWQGPTTVTFTSPRGLGQIEARAIVLATGCRERPRSARLVPGRRPQGIFTTGSLQRFVDQHHLPIGQRAVIVGAELVSLSALMTLGHAGVSVAAMVTDQPRHQIYFPYLPAKWYYADLIARTPIVTNSCVSDIVGGKRLEGIEITHLSSGQRDRLACDTLVFTGDWIPEHELARLGGLALDLGTRGPQVDAGFRTSARGVFAAGNLLRGAETADICATEGARVAGCIHDYLNTGRWPEASLPIRIASPIAWIFPNVVRASGDQPTASSFTFRVQEFCYNAQVSVCQGEKTLYVQSFRQCSPNDSIRLGGGWLAAVNPTGEALQVSIRHS